MKIHRGEYSCETVIVSISEPSPVEQLLSRLLAWMRGRRKRICGHGWGEYSVDPMTAKILYAAKGLSLERAGAGRVSPEDLRKALNTYDIAQQLHAVR